MEVVVPIVSLIIGITCSRCNKFLPQENFISKDGKKQCKTCNKCRERRRINNEKNKCEHGKRKNRCIICGGSSLCEHGLEKSGCVSCGGSCICIHKRQRYYCIDCNGNGICSHNRRRVTCKGCNGDNICEHNNIKYVCKLCFGNSLCIHTNVKSKCKLCKGNSICPHNKEKFFCRNCNGNAYCKHDSLKYRCKICNPDGHLINIVRSRVRSALQTNKSKKTIEYLGCTIEHFREHITKQFREGMSWDNYGEWEIDHIIPLMYNNPTTGEIAERLHWSNTQPLWAEENASKGNRYIG